MAAHTVHMVEGVEAAMRTRGMDADVLVLAEAVEDRPGIDRPGVHRCWNRRGFDVGRILDVLARERANLLHVQFDGELFRDSDLPGLLTACRRRGIRTFGTVHFLEPRADLAAEAVNLMDRAFVHLEQGARRMIAHGAQPHRLRVLPLGPSGSRSAIRLLEARRALELPEDLELITSLGRFAPDEGIAEVLQALPAVVSRHPGVQFAFLRSGQQAEPAHPEYARQCRDLAASLGIENHVTFAEGCLTEAEAGLYLAASDVIALNYDPVRPGAASAAAFVLAHGRPLLIAETSALDLPPDHVLHCRTQDGIATALNRVLEDPKLAARLEAGAQGFMERTFYRRLGELLLCEYGLAPDDGAARAA